MFYRAIKQTFRSDVRCFSASQLASVAGQASQQSTSTSKLDATRGVLRLGGSELIPFLQVSRQYCNLKLI